MFFGPYPELGAHVSEVPVDQDTVSQEPELIFAVAVASPCPKLKAWMVTDRVPPPPVVGAFAANPVPGKIVLSTGESYENKPCEVPTTVETVTTASRLVLM